MENNKITINKDNFKKWAYHEILHQQRILFDLCLDDYLLMPAKIHAKHKGKPVVIISLNDWKEFEESLSITFGDLSLARDLIKQMQPVFDEYYEEYEQKHKFNFDEYQKAQLLSYDSDEFEKVRDIFEKEYYKKLDDESLER
ncbi:hypothetical protein D3Z51_03470 [Clostridiaceae bacterium]|nr:hypothetical protein [Clostridiaceae bacterium]RKI16846.1 hypothetical protein D7V81_03750 [bacterium 1XD21-70]